MHPAPSSRFRFCLNTSTIRGQELSLPSEIDLASEVGYAGIEPWIREIDQHVDKGGSVADLAKRIADRGLFVESAIAFAEWIVDAPERRAKGLEEAKRSMDLVARLGGKRIAAPPVGATKDVKLDLRQVADRYRGLLELGERMGVVPQLEVWGFSANLSRLSEVLFVLAECGRPDACILPDIYHLYKGGNAFGAVSLLSRSACHVFHLNDYPAQPPRESITDADRVFPGLGVAPVTEVLRRLDANGCECALSLELFNRSYWKDDARVVARTGLDALKRVVEASRKGDGPPTR